jgi:hypothetical protein
MGLLREPCAGMAHAGLARQPMAAAGPSPYPNTSAPGPINGATFLNPGWLCLAPMRT